MSFRFNSAANRIAVISFAGYSAATFLLGVAVFLATHIAFTRQIDARMEQASAALTAEYREYGIAGVTEAVQAAGGSGLDTLTYEVDDATGKLVAGKRSVPASQPGGALLGGHYIPFYDPAAGPYPARAKVTRLGGAYRLVIAADLGPLEAIDETILTMFALTFAGLLLFGIAGAVLLARYLRVRLTRIEQTAAAIMAGDLGQRAKVGPAGDEFDRVAASLNAMLDRIAELSANLRQVTGDLAHDLRTPLSRLRNDLEGMRRQAVAPRDIAVIDNAVEQADEVLSLFDAILRISELEEGSLRRGFAPVDLSLLAREIGESHMPLAEDRAHGLQIAVAGDLMVQGDRELIAQALINLIENAMRHTPVGTVIAIEVRSHGHDIVAIVRDDGPGIAEADRARALRRFVRLEAARSTPGHGLGLSMAQAIATIHGATLTLGDAAPGLHVEIRFPGMRAS
jgi:signal transduction histidine kinase